MAEKTKSSDRLDELASRHALGMATTAEKRELARRLHKASPAARARVEAYRSVPAALAASLPPVAPPPTLKAAILSRAGAAQAAAGMNQGSPPPPHLPADPAQSTREEFVFVPGNDEGWFDLPVPGARGKVLSRNSAAGYVVLHVRLAPGGRYPEHDHSGAEECFVLSGDLQTEGRVLRAGDFLHAEPGSHHEPLFTVGGVEALLIVSAKDYL